MNNLFDDIATAIASLASADDVGAALAASALCIASASMFAAVFSGAL